MSISLSLLTKFLLPILSLSLSHVTLSLSLSLSLSFSIGCDRLYLFHFPGNAFLLAATFTFARQQVQARVPSCANTARFKMCKYYQV